MTGPSCANVDTNAGFGIYDRQLGCIGDALAVLMEQFNPKKPLTPDEAKAIRAQRIMPEAIDRVKKRHNRLTIKT